MTQGLMGWTGIRAVFFDAVGTLLHPDPPAAVVYAEVGRRFGSSLSIETIAQRFRAGFAREEAFDRQQGLRTSEERERRRWQHIVAEVFAEGIDAGACFQELYRHFSLPEAWRFNAEADPVLAELAERGYLLGVASNYDHRLRSVVACLPETQRLAPLVISSEVGWRKPAPEFFAALAEAAGLPAAQILFLGDDPENDYEGARAAGLRAVLWDPQGEAAPGMLRIRRFADLLARSQ
jgi:putative hydrolase of the HAD superfamily